MLEGLAVASGEVGELAVEEGQEDLLRGARQVEDSAEGHGAVIAGGAVQGAAGICDAGHDGVGVDAHADAGRAWGLGKVKGKESAEEAEQGVHYRTEGSGVSCWLV